MRMKLVVKNREAIDDTVKLTRQIIGASVLDVANELTINSPIDTGFFVNSWQAQANGQPRPHEGKEGPRGGVSAEDAATIFKGIGGNVGWNNTAVYAVPLARGHSPQAPDGWVESAANRLQDHIDRNTLEARRS